MLIRTFCSCLILSLLVTIIFTGQYNYLYYAGVMIGSIVFLNRQKAFNELPNYGLINAIFFGYLTFIVINRTRSTRFSDFTEGGLNIAEHGFFALVICLKLFVYLHLYTSFSFPKKAIFAALLFNTIGVLNEIFQSWLNRNPILVFIPDARKDLIANLFGSFLFLFLFNCFNKNAKSNIKFKVK
jgi:hypothetical protein